VPESVTRCRHAVLAQDVDMHTLPVLGSLRQKIIGRVKELQRCVQTRSIMNVCQCVSKVCRHVMDVIRRHLMNVCQDMPRYHDASASRCVKKQCKRFTVCEEAMQQ